MSEWNDNWYISPIPEKDYLDMAMFIYEHYDHIIRMFPDGFLDNLKTFITDGNCVDWEFTKLLMRSGILTNPEIGKRIIHWLTADVIADEGDNDA